MPDIIVKPNTFAYLAAREQKMTRVAPLIAGDEAQQGYAKARPESYEDYIEVYKDIAWVYKCVSAISEDCASRRLDVLLTKGKGEEAVEEDASDSDIALLLKHVNKRDTFSGLIATSVMHLQITGNAYWGLERDGKGAPMEVWALRPDRMEIKPDKQELVGGYIYKLSAETREFEPRDVVHFRLPNPTSDYYGLGPMTPATQAVIREYYLEQYERMVLKRWGAPAMTLHADRELSDTQISNTQRQLEERFQGTAKSGRVLVLPPNVKLEAFGMKPSDMMVDETRKATRDDIGMVFGVPPMMLGRESVNFATATQQERQYWTRTVFPYLRLLESGINEFLAPQFGEGLFVRFFVGDIDCLQEDKGKATDRILAAVDKRVITRNEARQLLREMGSMQVEGDVLGGDMVFASLNEVPIEQVGVVPEEEAEEQPSEEGDEEKLFHIGDDWNGNGEGRRQLARAMELVLSEGR